MSSVTSSFAQKSGRSKFLVGVTSGQTSGQNTWLSAFTFDSPLPTIPQSVIGREVFNAYSVSSVSISAGNLFKDLGREIVVVEDRTTEGAGSTSLHRNVFRECMRVNGATSEGIDGDEEDVRVWVKVFSAQGQYVAVARTG
jgi:hypothetical protein